MTTTHTAPYTGPAIFAGGYRVFFFMAAVWAILSLLVWVLFLAGKTELPPINMMQWHGHSLVYGYGGAVVAGFALTAIPNWTGRPPVRGGLLAVLAMLWLVPRVAELCLLAGANAEPVRGYGEVAFFALFIAIAAREVLAGKNWRNLKIIFIFSLFMLTAVAANLERLEMAEMPFPTSLAGLCVLVMLIAVIGGRIIPNFTANWMRAQGAEKLPVTFNKFDTVTLAVSLAALIALLVSRGAMATGALAFAAAAFNLARLVRWRGWECTAAPIVAVLHISYLWVPIGFVFVGLSVFDIAGIIPQAAIHAWTVGAIGSTTLAVMTRATMGHSNIPLADSPLLTSLYIAVNFAAIARMLAALSADNYQPLLNTSAVLWCVAFGLFILKFAPLHWTRQ